MRALWIVLAALSCVASADEPSAAAAARGQYVATAANCVSCHTREGGAAYAGGRPLATPLGTIHSTNITPDRETGIGSWTAQDLKRAMREGIAADGRHLFPAFPYPFYTRLSDRDIADLYAYLRTLKPVRYIPPDNDPAFRVRGMMAMWNVLNLDAGAYQPDPKRSAEWNRGAYLVQGPGHCGACHTPLTWTLAERSSTPLQGAVMRDQVKGGGVRDWFAVDLRATKQGLGAWTTEQLVDYLGKGFSARAGSFGPMNAVIANSTRHLAARTCARSRRTCRACTVLTTRGRPRPPAPRKPALRFTTSTVANAMAPRDAGESSTGRPWPAARSCRAKTRPR